MELKNLLNDMDVYASSLEKLLQKVEEKLKEIPYIDKLMAIREISYRGRKRLRYVLYDAKKTAGRHQKTADTGGITSKRQQKEEVPCHGWVFNDGC